MKRHAPFIAMTIAAFVLLFAAISRGSEPVWFDAAPDATPDVVVSEPEIKEVVNVVPVTPSVPADCPDGTCRARGNAQLDETSSCESCAAPTRPFRQRRGLFRRVFSR